jgi:hypothetical protein
MFRNYKRIDAGFKGDGRVFFTFKRKERLLKMKFEDLLSEKKSAILKRWFDAILETYPADTSNFLKNQKDQFANPVGHTILQGIEALFGEILKGMDYDPDVFGASFLDNIIRIRAIQDFTPSESIAFIFLLKKVIREELRKDLSLQNGIAEELFTLESKIDKLALLSFDLYMKCREKIYELKANEVKNSTFRLLKRANLICESQVE